ncbi:hypothetical protein E2C01_086633 [Portunus trituberculatus]|uniref:Uncharacterized protein n=1 Tax=Portunus trituberculatus TaxID=210409 RepID=A0A5B7JE03_PORTR|nr:hypothetical protein [Portunus trituberculatus]
MSESKAEAEGEQPGEGKSECEVPCIGLFFGDQLEHPEADRWRWWWCPIDESSGEKENESEKVTRTAKTLNLKELKRIGRKQKREEKMQKKVIKMTEVTDKVNTKPVKKQVNIEQCKKENDKAPTKMNMGRIELRNIKTGLEKVTTNTKHAARVPVTKAARRLSNAKRPRRLKKEMGSSTPQTQGSGQDSLLLVPLSTQKTRLRGVFTLRVAVAVLLLFHMILVQVFGYLMFYA